MQSCGAGMFYYAFVCNVREPQGEQVNAKSRIEEKGYSISTSAYRTMKNAVTLLPLIFIVDSTTDIYICDPTNHPC
jgi:hypothetical protein